MERSNTESKYILAGFLKFMGLDLEKIVKGRIENRIKAQKFVYFGEKLEVPLGYDFDIYLYGPYSSKLADDYYNISREEWEAGTIDLSEGEKRTLHYLPTFLICFIHYVQKCLYSSVLPKHVNTM